MRPNEFRIDLVANPYAWPGGYPRYAITADGAALCKDCCRKQAHEIDTDIPGQGWKIIDIDINWEDPSLFCDHCETRIVSAYAEDDAGHYQVTVGNIGTVYQGTSLDDANQVYEDYQDTRYGRAAGEPVTMWKDGEPIKEHQPTE